MSTVVSPGTLAAGARYLEVPRCSLVILSGSQRGQERVIEGDVFRVGKAADNDLVLADETVSRVHCEIARERKGYLLRGEPFQHRGLRPVDVDPLPAQLVTLESVVRACHAQGSREIRRLCEQALPDLAGGAL